MVCFKYKAMRLINIQRISATEMKSLLHKRCDVLSRVPLYPLVLLSIVILSGFGMSFAQNINYSAKIRFKQSHSNLDTLLFDNSENLKKMSEWIDSINNLNNSGDLRLKSVRVAGSASPEGTIKINNTLSTKRAARILDYFSKKIQIPDSITRIEYKGRDWNGLLEMVEKDDNLPSKEKVKAIINDIITNDTYNSSAENASLLELKRLNKGIPYTYMYTNMFPWLRYSTLSMEFEPVEHPTLPERSDTIPEIEIVTTDTIITDIPPTPIEIPSDLTENSKPFYMAIKTNLIHDALALPELSAEFYLGKGWSIVGNWTYGWWDNDNRHRYWRAYGGDLAVRKWFGKKAAEKPLTGHHLGLYLGAMTYDFEMGNIGYMGGLPHGTIFDRCNVYGGIEYGYSLPIARRLNLDFSIGIGYLGGKYIKYKPASDGEGYVRLSEHRLNWFGPTKAEISLTWLIGRGNYNQK